VDVKTEQCDIIWGDVRSPRKVNDCFRVVVEGQSACAVLAVIGADGCEAVKGCVGEIFVFDAFFSMKRVRNAVFYLS